MIGAGLIEGNEPGRARERLLTGSRVKISFAWIVLTLTGCAGADSMPVALPVPFSGSFTGETNIVIAEGTPTLGAASLKAMGKGQTLDNAPISWNLFKTQGAPAGTLTLF